MLRTPGSPIAGAVRLSLVRLGGAGWWLEDSGELTGHTCDGAAKMFSQKHGSAEACAFATGGGPDHMKLKDTVALG